MGLTIHYGLQLGERSIRKARETVAQLHSRASICPLRTSARSGSFQAAPVIWIKPVVTTRVAGYFARRELGSKWKARIFASRRFK